MRRTIRGIRLAGIAGVVVASLLVSGCGGGSGLTIGGSTTVQPLSEAWAEVFMEHNPDIQVTVQGGGSSAGVKGAAEGTIDIGAASREMKGEEESTWQGLRVYHVAADGVAIVVNPSVSIENLTLAEVKAIFGAGSNDEWTVVNREEGSGTREVFEDIVMSKEKVGARAEYLPSNGAVKQKVASTGNAIGYISLGYVDAAVKALTVDGIECSEQSILDGSYPVMRYLNYITNGDAEGAAREFIDFALGSEGQRIVASNGYIPIE